MNRTVIVIAAGLVLAAALPAAPSRAQNVRTFVSGQGSDSNPCTLGAPCRSFAGAILLTNAGGEIAILDTAGYGALTITKAISIVNPGGVEAGIAVAAGATAITISAGINDTIALRGLTLDGAGIGANGIVFTQGRRLEIENCVVRHFTGSGILVTPNGSNAVSYSISRTIVSDNSGGGIGIIPIGSNPVQGVIRNVLADNNSTGIEIDGANGSVVNDSTIIDSEASKNTIGVDIEGASATSAVVSIINSVLNYNTFGVYPNSGTTLLSRDTISRNQNSFSIPGHILYSYGDNDINLNINEPQGQLTSLQKH